MKRETKIIAIAAGAVMLGGCYQGKSGLDLDSGLGGAGATDGAADDGAGGSGGADGADSGEPGGDDSGPGDIACGEGSPGPRSLRLLTRNEYSATVVDLLNIEPPSTDSVPVEPLVDGYINDAPASVVSARHVSEYMNLAADIAVTAVDTMDPNLIGCMPADSECPRLFVESWGRKALRRPLTGEEVDLYTAMFSSDEAGGDFYEGVRLVVRGMLMSPDFIYRSEVGESIGDGYYRLTPYEVASALSYEFWGTMPDDELLDAADAGQLDDADGIETQARRLLDSARGRAHVNEFFIRWMGTAALLSTNKDSTIYPDFSDEVRESMAAEQEAFVEHVLFEGTATLNELLTADYVFVNDALADFYEMPRPGSSTPVKVDAPPESNRGGILSLGSVLASHAHPNESSPVRRGLFVRERLLCQVLPSPPEDVDATPPQPDPNATTRERFGQHSADPACKGCHELIDPLGFGFESYDGVGAFRSTENGKPVDATGEVVKLGDGADAVAFDGPHELAAILAGAQTTQTCVAHHYVRYAAGRSLTSDDDCAVDELAELLAEQDGNLHEMFINHVRLDTFVLRQEQE